MRPFLMLLAWALMAAPALAQTAATIKIIVPSTAGGGADTLARLLGDQISRKQGQTIVVENRPGASNTIGTEAVARAAHEDQRPPRRAVGDERAAQLRTEARGREQVAKARAALDVPACGLAHRGPHGGRFGHGGAAARCSAPIARAQHR